MTSSLIADARAEDSARARFLVAGCSYMADDSVGVSGQCASSTNNVP